MRVEGRDLVDLVLLVNVELYKGQVRKIATEFDSTADYFKSFIPPLIEETHTALLSSMRTLSKAQVVEISYIMPTAEFKLPKDLFYNVYLSGTSGNTVTDETTTQLIPKDLIAVTDKRPNRRVDGGFNISNEPYVPAMVCKADPDRPNVVTILASKPLFLDDFERNSKNKERPSLFGVYLTNITTNVRIWTALHLGLSGSLLKSASKKQ